jgi:hypothetical protein
LRQYNQLNPNLEMLLRWIMKYIKNDTDGEGKGQGQKEGEVGVEAVERVDDRSGSG